MSDSKKVAIILAVITVFFVFGLLVLGSFPPVNYLGDELGNLARSKTFISDAVNGATDGITLPRLYHTVLNLIFWLAGAGIAQGRFISLISASAVIFVVYLLGKEMLNSRVGLIAVVLLSSSYIFNWNSRIIRPEAMSTAFITLAFYLIYKASKENTSARFIFYGGFLAGISVTVHPNNLQYVPAIFIAALAIHLNRRLIVALGLYTLGVATAFLAWLIAIYIPLKTNPLAGTVSVGDVRGMLEFMPIAKGDFLLLFKKSVFDFYRDYVLNYLSMADKLFFNTISFWYFAVCYALVCILGIISTNRKIVFGLLGFVAFTLFINYFLTPHFGYWHMVEFIPFIALAAGVGIESASKILSRKQMPIYVLTALLAVPSIYNVAKSALELSYYKYKKVLLVVSSKIPPTAKVFAHEFYSPSFEGRYVYYNYDVDHPGTTCKPFADLLSEMEVDFIIYDDILRGFMRSSCGDAYETAAFRHLAEKSKGSELINITYPNYWASGRMLRKIYIFKLNHSGRVQ